MWKLRPLARPAVAGALRRLSSQPAEFVGSANPSEPPQAEPFSTLYVNARHANQMISVLKPLIELDDYTTADFQRQMRANLAKRGQTEQFDLDQLRAAVTQLASLRSQCEQAKQDLRKARSQLEAKQPDAEQLNRLKQLKQELARLTEAALDREAEVMPLLLRLPSLTRVGLSEDYALLEMKNAPEPKPFKLLDAKRISYIHGIRKSSVIGPGCDFLLGDGARMSQAIRAYFKTRMTQLLGELEGGGEVHEMSGLDLVKSAVVEACNDPADRPADGDRLRLNRGAKTQWDSQQMHLAGHGSLEAVCAMLSKRHLNRECMPLRFLQDGAAYDQRMQQSNTVHLVSVTADAERDANREYDALLAAVWALYQELRLPVTLGRQSTRLMKAGEFDSHEILVYFPQSRDWLKVAELSHYSRWLPRRLGLDGVQMMGGSLVSSNLLIDAILENTQDERGQYRVPACIKKFM